MRQVAIGKAKSRTPIQALRDSLSRIELDADMYPDELALLELKRLILRIAELGRGQSKAFDRAPETR